MMEYGVAIKKKKKPKEKFYDPNEKFSKSSTYTISPIAIFV